MKNKYIIGLSIILLLIVGFYFIKDEEVVFDNYVKVKIDTNLIKFKPIKLNDSIYAEFIIKNLNDGPFIITKIKKDNDIELLDFKILRIIDTLKETSILIKYKPQKIGVFEKNVYIESNAIQGNIIFKITGDVIR